MAGWFSASGHGMHLPIARSGWNGWRREMTAWSRRSDCGFGEMTTGNGTSEPENASGSDGLRCPRRLGDWAAGRCIARTSHKSQRQTGGIRQSGGRQRHSADQDSCNTAAERCHRMATKRSADQVVEQPSAPVPIVRSVARSVRRLPAPFLFEVARPDDVKTKPKIAFDLGQKKPHDASDNATSRVIAW
jgi:hypothetical protein